MGLVLIDTYRGENPGNFNNPPVNEVLVAVPQSDQGPDIQLYPWGSSAPGNQWASVRVGLLQPSQLTFTVTAVVRDGDVYRVKLAVPVAYAGNVPSGLNLGYVTISGEASNWGRALCSINLDAETLPVDYGPGPRVTGVSPTHGPADGGNLVQIYGTGLLNFTSVDFDGQLNPAFVLGWNASGTLLTVNPPGGTPGQTVDVTVTTTLGTSPINRPADQYTYDDASAAAGSGAAAGPVLPQVAGLNPSNGPVAGGNQVKIFGIGLTNAAKVKFGSNQATITPTQWDNDGQMTVIAPQGMIGSVDVTVMTPLGSSNSNPPADLYTYDSASVANPNTNGIPLDCPTRLANLSHAYAAWDTAIKQNLSASYIQFCYETVLAAQTAAEPCLVGIARRNRKP
jgi:hypothetical protein